MEFLIKNKSRQPIPVIIDTGNGNTQYFLMPFGKGSSVISKSMTSNMETLEKNKFIAILRKE